MIAGADVLWLGREELDLGREDDPLPTLRWLAGGRLRYVLWKRGARGGWLYDVAADALRPWTARTETVADPTGAGDAFAAGFVAGLLHGEDAAAGARARPRQRQLRDRGLGRAGAALARRRSTRRDGSATGSPA